MFFLVFLIFLIIRKIDTEIILPMPIILLMIIIISTVGTTTIPALGTRYSGSIIRQF